ncbi:hypothetical protein KI387_008353, partial [Taxus chinensis]
GDLIGVVVVINVDMIDVEGISVGYWDEIGGVAIGKDVSTREENSKVDVSGIVDVVDVNVAEIKRGESEKMMDVFYADVGIVKVGVVVVKAGIDVDLEKVVEVNGINVMIIDMVDIDVW